MCGRIALYTPPARVARFFQATEQRGGQAPPPPSFNVAPSREVLGVVGSSLAFEEPVDASFGGEGTGRLLVPLRWGLVPFWAKDPAVGNRMINARAESLNKPAFRRAFERRRCLVVADGFYEWRSERLLDGRPRRQPWFFRRADGRPLALAGLWESWFPPEGTGAPLRTCAIVTTEAGADVAPIHHRMPVVLETGDLDEWLGLDETGPSALQGLLTPSEQGTLVAYRVDPRVNRPDVDEPSLIQPLAEGGRTASQPGLPLGGLA